MTEAQKNEILDVEKPESSNASPEQIDAALVAERLKEKDGVKKKGKVPARGRNAKYNAIPMPKKNEPLLAQINPANQGISIPVYAQEVTIKSLQAQKVMRRVFTRASNSLYRIDVILRIIDSDKSASEVEKIIDDAISEVELDIENARERFEILLDNNGIAELPSYEVVYTEEIKIISPHVGRFLALVRKLDEIVSMIDALWLSGLMKNKDRNSELYSWQQRIVSLGARIIGIENRSREAARRQGKGEEVDTKAPEDKAKAIESVESMDEAE